MNRKQLTVFLIMPVVYAFSAFAIYAFFTDQLVVATGVPMSDMGVSNVVLGLANVGIVFIAYGILGWVGFLFARKLGLPGIFSEDGNWHRWFFIPLLLGPGCGVIFIIGDVLFAPINNYRRFVHPEFPVSILASIGAAKSLSGRCASRLSLFVNRTAGSLPK
jgi:hypothetical protein